VSEEIIRRCEQCLTEVLKETARRCGGAVQEEHGLLLVAANHPCPVFLNSALRIGATDAREVLRRAATFFGGRGHSWETWTRDGQDADLQEALTAAGMRVVAEPIGMVIESCPKQPELGESVEVRRVEEAGVGRDFVNVIAEGFQDEAACLPGMLRAVFSEPATLLAADTAAFVVYDGGEPASGAMTIVKEGVAWIGWVATRKESRSRGLGRLATAAATRAGFALGADCASLEATKMGAPVYQRLGYREVMRYRTYWPPSLFDGSQPVG
jgi:GNAT superfamily N-acetyltransferase